MRLCSKRCAALAVALALAAAPSFLQATTSCTTQAALLPQDRDALTAAGGRLALAVQQQNFTALKAALLPAVSGDWEGIRQAVDNSAPLLQGGQMQLQSLYLLDATSLTAPADAQFFCSNASGSLTVTLAMRALPPGRYAVVLANAVGGTYAGQLSFILAWDGPANGWRLGGLTLRPGTLDGHDGVWWWSRARELAKEGQSQSWGAWYAYEMARALLLPVDFLTSPNSEKLLAEQAAIKGSPQEAFPLTLADGPRTWKLAAMHLDISLLHAALGVVYESTGVTDPAAQRTEATAVLSAVLKAQPSLRTSLHGLWAHAVKDSKSTPILDLPMTQIP